MHRFVRGSSPRRGTVVVGLLALIALAACAPFGRGSQAPTPTIVATVSPTTMGVAAITLDEPAAGAVVSSPFVLRGRLAALPPEGSLTYRILDGENIVLGTGSITSVTQNGQGASFEVQVAYTAPVDGPGIIQIVQRNSDTGTAVALGSQVVELTQSVTTPPTAEGLVPTGEPQATPTGGPVVIPATPTPAPTAPPLPTAPQGQTITITSPAPGTTVGSPMIVTGNTGKFPFLGNLDYRVVDANNQQLGAGSFPVTGTPGQPSSFVGEVRFTLPPAGGTVRLDLYDQDNTSGQVAAIAALNLTVAPAQPTQGPQQITITSPPSGTSVGSPVVITGNTTRFPAQGTLKYRFVDRVGNQLGAGSFAVTGGTDQPGSFNASLEFNLPPGGGPVRLELADRDTNTGQTVAAAALDMVVNPPATAVPQQRISITSPPPGTTVGSPMTLTGNTVNYPSNGNLGYRVFNAANQQIGVGAFPVNGTPGQAANFTAEILFALPQNGGDIRVEVIDRDDASGSALASSSVNLRVAPPPPPTAVLPTLVVPTPLPTAPPDQGQDGQAIEVTAPVSGTVVSSPLIITGTTRLYPADGNLFYRVRDEAGAELGSGTFNVRPQPGNNIAFQGELRYTAPAVGTIIRVEIVDQSDRERSAPRARVEVRYQFQPQPAPR